MQKDFLDSSGNLIRTSYEVEDANEDVIGRFGSLAEAESFITLLSKLNPQSLMGQCIVV
ncbi:MAG: hypothetical protein MJK15_14690 [Colwellia sp.]|nr:hypothetical protein [Colwellia sp.]